MGGGIESTSSVNPTFGSQGGAPKTTATTFGSGSTSSFRATGVSTSGTAQLPGGNATPSFGAASSSNIATATPPFGTTTSAPPMFGTVASVAPSFGVGTSTFGGASGTTPSFGTAVSASPSFGSISSAVPSLGAVASVPSSFGATGNMAPSFGAATSSSFGMAASTPSSFGTAASFGGGVSSAPSFGAVAPAAPTFETAGGAAPSFEATSTFGSGAPLSFGIPSSTVTSTTSAGFNFKATQGSGFPTPSSISTPAAGGLSPSKGWSVPTPSTSASPSTFKLPTSTSNTSSASGGITFGVPLSTSQASGSLFPASKPSFGMTLPLGSALPGSMTDAQKSSLNTPSSGNQPKTIRDSPIPAEICGLIEKFQEFVKSEKVYSSEVTRASPKPHKKITEDADGMRMVLMKLERTVSRNNAMNARLKNDTMRGIADCEVAQRCVETPNAFQCDSNAIMEYFKKLVDRFHEEVIALKVEIENAEKHILCALNPKSFTPQELSFAMQRLYECFVALAGRFQVVHSSIANLKQRQLDLRRQHLNDMTNIFAGRVRFRHRGHLLTPGPTPFSGSVYPFFLAN